MNRRAFLGGLAGAVPLVAGASAFGMLRGGGGSGDDTLRVGVMSNLTHAPLLAGLGSGRIAEMLAPVKIDARIFRAGPRVTEALIGDAIDVGTAGPAPVVVHHARHAAGGNGLRVLSGCCSGGASFIVTRLSGITRAEDVRGKRLAITQIGTTQDIALRSWLRNAGLRDRASGGDVTVLALAPATILDQLKRGELHGAWLAEPWATRMVTELGAVRWVDERSLWEGGRFTTALLVARAQARPHDAALHRLVVALDREVTRANAAPLESIREAHAYLRRHLGNPGSLSIFEKASAFMDFTSDPLRESVVRFGETAASFGFCSPHPTEGLFG